MLPFLAWLGFAWFERAGRHRAAGVSLALALVKPQLILVLLALLVWKRRWTTLAPFAAIAAVLGVASLIVSGPGVLIEYPRFVLGSTEWTERGVDAANMFGWNGVLASWAGAAEDPLFLLLSAPTIALVAFGWRGDWDARSPRFLLKLSLALAGCVLVNPHVNIQDLVLVILVVAFGAAYWQQRFGGFGPWLAVAAALWLLHIYGFFLLQVNYGVNLLTPALAMTGLLALRQFEDDRQRESVEPESRRLAAA
jgi:hypothetical protein